MATLSRTQVAQFLYDAGFRGDDLIKMVAIAGRESGYQTDAHRTDQDKSKVSGDRGLFQINYVNDKGLLNAGIITSKSDLFDPAVAARAAKWLFDQSGLAPWAAGPGGWKQGGDPLYGTKYDETKSELSGWTPGATSSSLEAPTVATETVVRDTQYDPTYTEPKTDPKAQKGLTDMLGRFGIDYPDAPRATPQLLAFMRGLGLSYDTIQDAARVRTSQVEGRSADARQDLQRADQRQRVAITSDLQQRNVLSSGAANTQYARQAEDVVAKQADITRSEADAIGNINIEKAAGQDALRTRGTEVILSEEEKQATDTATSKERVRDFNARRTEADYQDAQAKAARVAYLEQQKGLYTNVGLGVRL